MIYKFIKFIYFFLLVGNFIKSQLELLLQIIA